MKSLTATRMTIGIFLDNKEEFKITDSWTNRTCAHRSLLRPWIGMSIVFVKSCSSEICIDGSNLHSVRAREASLDTYSCLCLQRVSPQLLIPSVGRSETTHLTTALDSYCDRVNIREGHPYTNVSNPLEDDPPLVSVFNASVCSERACMRSAQH